MCERFDEWNTFFPNAETTLFLNRKRYYFQHETMESFTLFLHMTLFFPTDDFSVGRHDRLNKCEQSETVSVVCGAELLT